MEKKILVVDDISGWINFHTNNIKSIDPKIRIDSAQSALAGLAKIETSINNPYTTIFTDLQMESNFLPKFAGEWFIEQIKQFSEYNNTKIVIVSASDSISQIAKKLDVAYISKFTIRNATNEIYKPYL